MEWMFVQVGWERRRAMFEAEEWFSGPNLTRVAEPLVLRRNMFVTLKQSRRAFAVSDGLT